MVSLQDSSELYNGLFLNMELIFEQLIDKYAQTSVVKLIVPQTKNFVHNIQQMNEID